MVRQGDCLKFDSELSGKLFSCISCSHRPHLGLEVQEKPKQLMRYFDTQGDKIQEF